MKTYFRCPDGETIHKNDCLKKCRMQQRCLSPPTLAAIAEERKFRGVTPSSAGKGDRAIYLEVVTPYTIDPKDQMFLLYGTRHHGVKEDAGNKLGYDVERYLPAVGGIADCYDKHERILYDSKFLGSGALERMAVMGWEETGEVYRTNGKGYKKGDKKRKKVLKGFAMSPDHDYAFQVNRYRMGLEAEGDEVVKMLLEATLRDGNTMSAHQRGFDRNVYLVEVPRIDDDTVARYYDEKDQRVKTALRHKRVPPICGEEERWGGTRCKYYCPVFEECARAGGWTFKALREIVKARRK